MTNPDLPRAKTAAAVRRLARDDKAREKLFPASTARNPLKSLDSDEIVRDLRSINGLPGR